MAKGDFLIPPNLTPEQISNLGKMARLGKAVLTGDQETVDQELTRVRKERKKTPVHFRRKGVTRTGSYNLDLTIPTGDRDDQE